MSINRWLLAVLLPCCAVVAAQDLDNPCRMNSSYDLRVSADALRFDRDGPAPRLLEWRAGKLSADGAGVALSREDGDRLRLFEEDLRALLPRVRRVATDGVDLAMAAVQAETVSLGLTADSREQLDAELARHAAGLKRRIAASASTHDWQAEWLERQLESMVADIMPLLVADLGQQALDAVMAGDLAAAARLRDRAAHLASDLRPRLERRLQALRPSVERLCPAMQRLYELQRNVRGGDGKPLDLLELGGD